MRIAVDMAVWRIRPFGVAVAATGIVALLISGALRSAGLVAAAVAAIVAGAVIARSRRSFVRRDAAPILQTCSRTLALLSLPHSTDHDRFAIEVPGCLSIHVRRVPGGSLVAFVPARLSAEREEFLVRTLLKYQRTLQTIF